MVELNFLNILSFLLIFFIGLPHGSFDGAIASLGGYKTKIQFIKFLLYYLILFFLVILFWIYFPILSLLIFLLMTIAHFGLCDWTHFKIEHHKFAVSFTYGMTVIFGIIFLMKTNLFKYLNTSQTKIFIIFKIFFMHLTQ